MNGVKLLFVTFIMCAPQILAAQDTTNVSLDNVSKDDLGKRIVARLRQKIASSALLKYISDNSATSLKLKLVTLDPSDESSTQHSTVYSEVLIVHDGTKNVDYFLTSYVGTCGANKVEECADSIFSDLDEWAEQARKSK